MPEIQHLKKANAEQIKKNSSYKISISYPPLPSEKGIPLLGQNRQFQWFNNPTYIYPMVPSYAATLLQSYGYDVMWDDGIAEELSADDWLERLKKFQPDLIIFESKTPVIKRHWKLIEIVKKELLTANGQPPTIVLIGDHVTAMPEESMEKSKVDYIATGGDYDFLVLNIANHINHGEKLEPGIWYREAENPKSETRNPKQIQNSKYKIQNTGHFLLNHDLDELPVIDRDLTKWKLYAYKNGNYKRTPGTYTYAARDCWWGKCTFCFPPETKIATQNGFVSIGDIVDNKSSAKVITHKGRYRKITDWHERFYKGNLIELEAHYLVEKIKLTPNHPVFINRLEDKDSPKIISIPAEEIRPGDYLSIPIERTVKDIENLNLSEIIKKESLEIQTWKKMTPEVIKKIEIMADKGISQRQIANDLKIDRETVKRYIVLFERNELMQKINPLVEDAGTIRFEGGKKSILKTVDLSEDFLRLAGYYLAEGHTTRSSNRPNSAYLGLTFSNKEKDYITDAQDIFKQSFETPLNITENKVNHTTQLYFGSSILTRTFELLFGKNCLDKSLPADFMRLPLEKQRQLLVGLFRGDGHVRKERKSGGQELIYSTVSEKLARQVYQLLLRQNIVASLRMPKPGKKTKNQAFSIHIYGKDIQQFFPDSEISNQSHRQKGFIFEDNALLPVKTVASRPYSGDVYNITVEDDHSYTAGFFAVKNCSWTTLYPGKDYRRHSAKRVLDEIGVLIEKYGVVEVMDDSGSFPIGEWLKEFCEGMIKRGYNKKIKIDCNMRLKALSPEEYKLMGKAGFRFILYGLESANQATLDRIHKNLKVEEIEKGVKMAKEGGLEPHITTMMGYPWETKEDAERTIELSKKLFNKGYVDTLQATIVIPYPGTPLFKECLENNWLKTKDWDEFDQRMAVMKSPLTEADIKELTQGLYKSFVTPKFIVRKILSVRSFDDVKFLFRAAGKVFGHLLDFSAKTKSEEEKCDHGCDKEE